MSRRRNEKYPELPEFESNYVSPPKEDVEFWEKKLQEHGLGMSQLAEKTQYVTPTESAKTWQKSAMQLVDATALDGFGVRNARSVARPVPSWALDDKKVAQVIRYIFPRVDKFPSHRIKAGRWARALYLAFRVVMPAPEIAEELGITTNAVHQLIHRIRTAGDELFPETATEIQSHEEKELN